MGGGGGGKDSSGLKPSSNHPPAEKRPPFSASPLIHGGLHRPNAPTTFCRFRGSRRLRYAFGSGEDLSLSGYLPPNLRRDPRVPCIQRGSRGGSCMVWIGLSCLSRRAGSACSTHAILRQRVLTTVQSLDTDCRCHTRLTG